MKKGIQKLIGEHGKGILIAHIIMILCILGADLSSKIHSEQVFLKSSGNTTMEYHSTREHIFSLGNSPMSVAQKKSENSQEISSNWVELNFTYVRNPGVAWGFMSNLPDKLRLPFLQFLTIGMSFFLILWYSQEKGIFARTILAMIFGGAVGNILDRMFVGYVVDWIQVNWHILGWRYNFPVFNVADSSISAGGFFLFLSVFIPYIKELFQKKSKKEVL